MNRNDPALALWARPAFFAFALTMLVIEPALAQGALEPLENLADFIVSFLTGAFARSVAIIAVAVLGYLGLTGQEA